MKVTMVPSMTITLPASIKLKPRPHPQPAPSDARTALQQSIERRW
jgi:hypothetical protein